MFWTDLHHYGPSLRLIVPYGAAWVPISLKSVFLGTPCRYLPKPLLAILGEGRYKLVHKHATTRSNGKNKKMSTIVPFSFSETWHSKVIDQHICTTNMIQMNILIENDIKNIFKSS